MKITRNRNLDPTQTIQITSNTTPPPAKKLSATEDSTRTRAASHASTARLHATRDARRGVGRLLVHRRRPEVLQAQVQRAGETIRSRLSQWQEPHGYGSKPEYGEHMRSWLFQGALLVLVQREGMLDNPCKGLQPYNRDPYIIHLNIALSMVVSPYFWGNSHVSNGQNVSFKEPC